MLKQIKFINWKSFKDSILYIDPLTFLIGTNASGKSNILDGISFINRISKGKSLETALAGEPGLLLDGRINSIRGGSEWAARRPGTEFTIEAIVEYEPNIDYEYSITVNTHPQVELVAECLVKIEHETLPSGNKSKEKKIKLFSANVEEPESPSISCDLYNGKGRQKKKQFKRPTSLLTQLNNVDLRDDIRKGIEFVTSIFEDIFILDPVPTLMRDYTSFSKELTSNASNLAGVLAALSEEQQSIIENHFKNYLNRLPEGEIKRVWAEPIGLFKNDAMLYCEELWTDKGQPLTVDARGMSDGTLRFLGILTALLTRPKGKLIVIEEVDNGLHPSRARLLLEMLGEIGKQRNIDLLITTHNPALLDQLGPEMIPYIVISHRSVKSGESQLALLEDIKNLPKLMSFGTLGKLATEGVFEEALHSRGRN